ncbi:MAG: efflux RND transporter permease subunit [Candidatus Baltobacteraceae bacterium]
MAIDFPWATVALWSAIVVAGIWSFLGLKLALFPDISFPVVVVTAHSSEIDPLVNERNVTVPLEQRLRTIAGIANIHSLTYPEFVVLDMSFDVGGDLDRRKVEVEDAIRGMTLPAGTTTGVLPLNLNATAIVSYAIVKPGLPLAELARIAARDVAPKLKAIPGVLDVQILGGQSSGPNASAFRYEGQRAIAVNVVKAANANTIDVAEACDDAVEALRAHLPSAELVRFSSQATYIREATRSTEEALLLAVLLAICVILPFLRDWRATAISAVAIPTSLLGTTLVMRLLHFNLETITLLALALVVGVILDDAIVAVENIVRHLEAGETPRAAALNANKEIGLTLVAATLTIVAVFLPIGLMRGTLGQFFKPFGLTASAAVLFSLLAARTLSPTLAANWLHRRADAKPGGVDVNRTDRYGRYRRLLTWALGHRRQVVLIAVAAFAAGLALIPFIPKGFIPHLDRGSFRVNFQTPLGTSLEDTASTAQTLEDSIRRDPAVSAVYTTIGGRPNQYNVGVIDVHLRGDRRVKTIDVEDAVRERLPVLDGVVTAVADVPFVGSDTSKPLQFALLNDDLDRLRTVGRTFQHRLEKAPGFVDVTASGLSDGTPFSAIEHVGGKRAVQITADLIPSLQLGDANDLVLKLARKELPPDVKLVFAGSSADAVNIFRDFALTLALSVVAIVVVLLILFRSWVDPLVISVSLPLSIVGALFALWITRADFGLISLMGVIFLFGLVNKNAILLVDRIEKLRKLGFARGEAILEAGTQRLRPIVMTTSATILGMLPIAFGFGTGAELRAPMAVAIIGGLVTSTLLSLIVVPVVYTLVDDVRRKAEPA